MAKDKRGKIPDAKIEYEVEVGQPDYHSLLKGINAGVFGDESEGYQVGYTNKRNELVYAGLDAEDYESALMEAWNLLKPEGDKRG